MYAVGVEKVPHWRLVDGEPVGTEPEPHLIETLTIRAPTR
jgi:hypothetical protein